MTYKEFINDIIKTRGQWNISEGEYYETHHIIPRCLGGEPNDNQPHHLLKHQNLIWLYPEEHYMAHKLLALENYGSLALLWAWDAMAYREIEGRKYEVSAEDYALSRKLHSEYLKLNPININPETGRSYLYQTNLSESTKQKIGKANKGRLKGIPKSEATKAKMRKKRINTANYGKWVKGKIHITNGISNLMVEEENIPNGWHRGVTKNPDTSNYYKAWTEEKKEKMAESKKGSKNYMYGKGYLFSNGGNPNAKYIYTFLGKDYDCKKSLLEFLRQDYPHIDTTTINKIMDNTYTKITSKKYQFVIDNLSWRLKDED